ncbi:MAG: Xaa-Pro peptidase family protein [Desulfopila sp.]|jgi:Xaa-Pro dipeptidase|nr:Xaa-Pro peptidase family protein [Desulfopila sp.]
MIQSRFEALTKALDAAEFSGIALNAGASLTYFTGLDFHLMERPVVLLFIPSKKPVLILPQLEAAKVTGIEGMEFFFYDEDPDGWQAVFAEALVFSGAVGANLAVEPLQLRLLEYSLLQKSGRDLLCSDGSSLIAALRSRKDPDEIELLQKAVDIAQNALVSTLSLIRIGMTEKELAGELVMQLFRHGSDASLPFSPIVASGPNGANPHSRPSARKLTEGDLLVIDWGAAHDGYVSDLTRTFAVGNIDAESAAIHEIVQQANSAGRKAGGVGVPCDAVDRAARQVIDKAGYGKFFTHRTGHGIGKQCHEEPYLRKGNGEILAVGMTYTVEPGIYLPGKNGVRIEDDVVVTTEGVVSLSNLPRKIIQVG